VIFCWGGALTIIAMNFKMMPKPMLGFHKTIFIFVICLDSKSIAHFCIITKCYVTAKTVQVVTVPHLNGDLKNCLLKLPIFLANPVLPRRKFIKLNII
jgi:hypothetical protein